MSDKIFLISGSHSNGIGCFPFHYLLDSKGHVIRVNKGKDGKPLIIDLGEIGERKKTEPGEYYTFDGCIRHALTPEEYLEWLDKTPKWSIGYECPYTLRKERSTMTTTRTNKISNEELWRLETQEGWSLTRIVRELKLSDAVLRRYEKYRDKQRQAAAQKRLTEARRQIEAEVDLEREMGYIAQDRDNQGGTWGR